MEVSMERTNFKIKLLAFVVMAPSLLSASSAARASHRAGDPVAVLPQGPAAQLNQGQPHQANQPQQNPAAPLALPPQGLDDLRAQLLALTDQIAVLQNQSQQRRTELDEAVNPLHQMILRQAAQIQALQQGQQAAQNNENQQAPQPAPVSALTAVQLVALCGPLLDQMRDDVGTLTGILRPIQTLTDHEKTDVTNCLKDVISFLAEALGKKLYSCPTKQTIDQKIFTAQQKLSALAQRIPAQNIRMLQGRILQQELDKWRSLEEVQATIRTVQGQLVQLHEIFSQLDKVRSLSRRTKVALSLAACAIAAKATQATAGLMEYAASGVTTACAANTAGSVVQALGACSGKVEWAAHQVNAGIGMIFSPLYAAAGSVKNTAAAAYAMGPIGMITAATPYAPYAVGLAATYALWKCYKKYRRPLPPPTAPVAPAAAPAPAPVPPTAPVAPAAAPAAAPVPPAAPVAPAASAPAVQ